MLKRNLGQNGWKIGYLPEKMAILPFSDEYFMQQALVEARKAYQRGEVPIGAVIVSRNRIIARAHNLTEALSDVTAHAEMQAITSAAHALGGKYLKECRLFVTIEPCLMCAGALFWSQIDEIVFGARDEKRGYLQFGIPLVHPSTLLRGGVLEEACSALIRDFFALRRKARLT